MKKSNLSRLLCLILAALLTLGILVSCNDTEGDEKETTTVLSDDTQDTPPSTVDTNGFLLDNVPTDTLDYKQAITLLTWSDVEHEEFVAEVGQTGEPVNDAIYLRNLAVEERLGIELKYISTPGNSSNIANWVSFVRNAIQSSSDSFDLMCGYSLSMASTASNGLCYNLLDPDCNYLDFEMPWWPDRLITQATINDKLYFCSGDISGNALYMMYACFVNNDIVEGMGLPNIFELVDNNQWTYTKFIEMCQGVYLDKNGDGKKSVGDRFGYFTEGIQMDPWLYGSGALIVDKDANGQMRMSPTLGGEKVIKTLEILNNLLYNTNDGICPGDTSHQQKEFNDGNVMFITDRARTAVRDLLSEDLNFSVVPFAKYDEAQENYVTVIGNPYTLYAIPIDAKDTELMMLSAIIEVYASESYRKLTPAIYEITLKIKYVQDADSARMYDIIRENLTFDLGRIFSNELVSQAAFRRAVKDNAAGTWASTIKGYERTLPMLLDRLIKAYSG